jgi:hypothetical protein
MPPPILCGMSNVPEDENVGRRGTALRLERQGQRDRNDRQKQLHASDRPGMFGSVLEIVGTERAAADCPGQASMFRGQRVSSNDPHATAEDEGVDTQCFGVLRLRLVARLYRVGISDSSIGPADTDLPSACIRGLRLGLGLNPGLGRRGRGRLLLSRLGHLPAVVAGRPVKHRDGPWCLP